MLQAIYNKKIIHVDDFDVSTLKRLSETKTIFCPDCQKTVLFKECLGKQHHFAHYKHDCSSPFSEAESIEHETGKKAIFNWLIPQFTTDDVFIEKRIIETNQRSDTFVSSIRTAFEYQCSPIQAATWRKRNELYQNGQVQDIWILGYSMHKYANDSPYMHKLNSLEEAMYQQYGRIFYFDVLTHQFIFLIPDKKQHNTLIGKEYFFKPNEVYYKKGKLLSKYDYFLDSQQNRMNHLNKKTLNVKKTDQFIKAIQTKTIGAAPILATKKQVNYIKVLLTQTNQTIPYKLHGLRKKEADTLIKELEARKKIRT